MVLTGGPCCGKSTTINELKKRGYSILEEVAREILQEERYKENKDYELFQEEIFKRQVEKESKIVDLTFLDRSTIDGIAYSLLYLKYIPFNVNSYDLRNRYSKIFFLDRFPLQKDGIRVEGDEREAQKVHEKIREAYLIMGYSLTKVPIMPIEERTDYILEKIK